MTVRIACGRYCTRGCASCSMAAMCGSARMLGVRPWLRTSRLAQPSHLDISLFSHPSSLLAPCRTLNPTPQLAYVRHRNLFDACKHIYPARRLQTQHPAARNRTTPCPATLKTQSRSPRCRTQHTLPFRVRLIARLPFTPPHHHPVPETSKLASGRKSLQFSTVPPSHQRQTNRVPPHVPATKKNAASPAASFDRSQGAARIRGGQSEEMRMVASLNKARAGTRS